MPDSVRADPEFGLSLALILRQAQDEEFGCNGYTSP